MSFQSFFNYPSHSTSNQAEDLLFLPFWNETQWGKLLGYTANLRFRLGDTIIKLGDTDSAIYIITEGQVEILGIVPGRATGTAHTTPGGGFSYWRTGVY